MYPYQKEEIAGRLNPLSEIQIPISRKWRWLQSLSSDCLLFASISLKMNRRKFWTCVDSACEKFQKLPQYYLNTNDEDLNFYKLNFAIKVPTANGAFVQAITTTVIELVDEPIEIITTVHLCPPQEKQIALMQKYHNFLQIYKNTIN